MQIVNFYNLERNWIMKKRILVIIMAAAMIFSLMVFPAVAADYKLGDVNGDGRVTPADVTALRLYLAGKIDETITVNKQTADLNQDGRIKIGRASCRERV